MSLMNLTPEERLEQVKKVYARMDRERSNNSPVRRKDTSFEDFLLEGTELIDVSEIAALRALIGQRG